MGNIIKLNKNLANQIAAGEVVERPSSIVKELVENSIDAGATNISINIIDGGIKEISISDDGTGIQEEDLDILGEKHSTSKIKSIEDLYNIISFGFRGEALASIFSVSDTILETKTIKDKTGNRITITGGSKQKKEKITKSKGTKITIKNLFYNTPARLNYLKKPKTEYNHILSYLHEATLAYPQIGFEFISDDKTVFNYKSNEDLKTRIYNIYGKELYSSLIDINFELNGIKINGYISDPKVSFLNKNRQHLFINKRPIKSYSINKAISDAYNRFIPHSSFPAYILYLEIDPSNIDVNVHPRKLEVRFENEQLIFKAFYHAVEEKLNSISLINDIPDNILEKNINNNYENIKKNNYYSGSGLKFKPYSPYKDVSPNPSQTKISDAISFSKEILTNTNVKIVGRLCEDEKNTDLHYTKLGKIIGQAHNSYIIVETPNGIVFYDQHALAERIIYEKLINNDKMNQIQSLLVSESFNLTPQEAIFLNDNIDIFREIGFDLELLNSNILIINGIPDFLKKDNIQKAFSGILEDIGTSGLKKTNSLEEVKNKIFAYTACRSAIKFGHKLNLFEMNGLLNDAVNSYSSTCPHGRPVIYEINLNDLKGKYER